jgi:hypothetical protein
MAEEVQCRLEITAIGGCFTFLHHAIRQIEKLQCLVVYVLI